MTWRVQKDDVRAIIEADSTISMSPFIEAANALTDWLVTQDTAGTLTTGLLVAIERNLAAHFYEARDQAYSEKMTEKASAVFQGRFGMGLERTSWGQNAMTLDVTGNLAKQNRGRHKVGVSWGGLAPSDQTDYVDRD